MNHNYIKYRGAYIDTLHLIYDDGDREEWVALIYHNGEFYQTAESFISETKAIDKAKKYIDELLEETNG